MARARKLIFNLHLIFGLASALFLLLMGTTGAFLAYEYQIDRLLNPSLFYVTPSAPRLPLATLIQNVRGAHPDATVEAIDLAAVANGRPDVSYQVRLIRKGEPEPLHVFIDPYTGRILGQRSGNGFAAAVHELHANLLLGKSGQLITTTLSGMMVVLAVTGLILWWPRKLMGIKRGSSFGRVNFELHNTVGFYMSLLILLFGITGIGVHIADWFAPAVDRMAHAPLQHEPPVVSKSAPVSQKVGIDEAERIGASAVPGARVTYIALPKDARGAYRVRLKFPEDRQTLGRSYAHVDQYSGVVVWTQSTRETAVGTRYFKFWNREVHNGTAWGAPYQFISAVTGLSVPLLAITGPLIWWRKNRKRLMAANESPSRVAGRRYSQPEAS